MAFYVLMCLFLKDKWHHNCISEQCNAYALKSEQLNNLMALFLRYNEGDDENMCFLKSIFFYLLSLSGNNSTR